MSSTQELITKAKNFTASKVAYRPAKVNSRGGKNVALQVNGNPLVIQFPLMLTWGVNERVDEQSGRVSYDMALQFGSGIASVEKFQMALKELENKILDDATTSKCKEWFGKSKMSREVAEAMMYPILKYPKVKDGPNKGEPDYERYPTLKLKLPYWEQKFNVELYNMDRKAIFPDSENSRTPMDLVPKASYVKGLLACTGIWMAGGRFGVTWKLVQAAVRPPTRLVGTGTCHIDDDSDDEDALDQLKNREAKANPHSAAAEEEEDLGPTFDDDDEDEEAEPEEEVAEPEPVKKKKKKVVRRKKKAATSTE
jgi:hypothetical protein|tara:strand:- start:28 stop:957 length:930 start_codon:yes stop_codon:yes gene_type:complete